MEYCEYCGKKIGSDYFDECDGALVLDTDPYAEEINEDFSLYWMCRGQRHESAMDI